MKVVKNYIFNLMYQLLSIALPIITIPYMSRILGPEGVGNYTLTFTYAQYFVLLGLLGLDTYSSREIAFVRDDNDKLNKTFWELLIGRGLTLGISFMIYVFVIVFFVNGDNKLLQMIQALIILSSLIDISWLFIGLENFKRVVLRNSAVKLIGTVLIFIFVKESSDIWIYALILSGSQLLGQIVMWWELPRTIHYILPRIRGILNHLKHSFKMFIPQIAINVYTMFDKVILGIIAGEAQVGLYDNSQRIIKILITVVTSLSTVMIPQLTNQYKNEKYEEFNQSIYQSFSFVSLLAFPMTFGLIAICKGFVPWFFGPGFEGIIPMFYIGAFLMITLAWSSVFGLQVLLSIKRIKEFTIAVSIGAVINITLNFILIKRFEGVGATIASVIAEYIGMIIMMYFIRDIIKIGTLLRRVLTYLIASLLMFIVMWSTSLLMNHSLISLLLLVVIGVVVYAAILIVTKDYFVGFIIEKSRTRMGIMVKKGNRSL